MQIGVPSRSELESYGAIEAEIDAAVAELNARHARARRAAAGLLSQERARSCPSLVALYRLAHFCIVSSLHDGMNLVAKEFVAARDDEDGVLVLSALAGAAQELQRRAHHQPVRRRRVCRGARRARSTCRATSGGARMRAMRRIVAGRNVFSWASDILEGLESLWTKPLQYAAHAPEDTPV